MDETILCVMSQTNGDRCPRFVGPRWDPARSLLIWYRPIKCINSAYVYPMYTHTASREDLFFGPSLTSYILDDRLTWYKINGFTQ